MKTRISVIIVDDDHNRSLGIRNFITTSFDFLDVEVAVCDNVHDAVAEITSRAYDMAIIDLQLPSRSGSAPEPKGGFMLITAMDGMRKSPLSTICLTAYEEIATDQGSRFLDLGIVLIRYSAADDGWQRSLQASVTRTSEIINRMSAVRYNCDFVIFCATDTEFETISSTFTASDEGLPELLKRTSHRIKSVRLTLGDSQVRSGIIAQAMRMGPSAAASMTACILGSVKTEVALMTGICAGFASKCNLRDLIIVESAFNWDGGKLILEDGLSKLVPDHDSHRCSSDFSSIARDALDASTISEIVKRCPISQSQIMPSVCRGSLATGSSVVASEPSVASIQQRERQCMGIDMEAYAFYQTIYSLPIKPRHFGVIKSVSDFANSEKSDRDHAACLCFASNVAKEIVVKLLTIT